MNGYGGLYEWMNEWMHIADSGVLSVEMYYMCKYNILILNIVIAGGCETERADSLFMYTRDKFCYFVFDGFIYSTNQSAGYERRIRHHRPQTTQSIGIRLNSLHRLLRGETLRRRRRRKRSVSWPWFLPLLVHSTHPQQIHMCAPYQSSLMYEMQHNNKRTHIKVVNALFYGLLFLWHPTRLRRYTCSLFGSCLGLIRI